MSFILDHSFTWLTLTVHASSSSSCLCMFTHYFYICQAASIASEARPIIAVYLRFRDIYVCLHVHCTRPCTPYTSPIMSAHCALSFGRLAAVRSTTLRSCPFARYGQQCQFSWRQPRQWQRLKPYNTTIGHRKRSTEERTICSRTTSAYSFLYYFFILYM